MVLLIRFILISLIIYLIMRSVARFFNGLAGGNHDPEPEKKDKRVKGVPKEVGEYVDYEEVD